MSIEISNQLMENKHHHTKHFHSWVVRFRNGRDGPNSDRLITAHTQKNIEAIRMIINEDLHSTYYDIEALTSLSKGSKGTILSIIHDSLKLRNVTSRWSPHFWNEQNRNFLGILKNGSSIDTNYLVLKIIPFNRLFASCTFYLKSYFRMSIRVLFYVIYRIFKQNIWAMEFY